MPYRRTPLITGEYYHLFNRSIHKQPILTKKRNIDVFLEMMTYYTQVTPPTKYSYFKMNRKKYKLNYINRLVTIVAYCVMPNHFHLLVRQEVDSGIRSFLQRTLNAYVHYYNFKHQQKGPLFEAPFKAVRVESDAQLIHLARYIHLNPVTDYMVDHPKDYPYSSINQLLDKNISLPFNVDPLSEHFKNTDDYLTFVLDNKDYQRERATIKHLIIDE